MSEDWEKIIGEDVFVRTATGREYMGKATAYHSNGSEKIELNNVYRVDKEIKAPHGGEFPLPPEELGTPLMISVDSIESYRKLGPNEPRPEEIRERLRNLKSYPL